MTVKQTPKQCPNCGALQYKVLEIETEIGVILGHGCVKCGHREKEF